MPLNETSTRVESLLSEFLAAHEDPTDESFEIWVKTHPTLEQALRRAFSTWRKTQLLLDDSGEPVLGTRLVVGDQVGEFRLEALLGRGGQGMVWRAHQESFDRYVALKIVRPERLSERSLSLFHREARAGGRFSHADIVAIHEWGESDGVHWIAQELVPGGRTLRDVIDEERDSVGESPPDYRWTAECVARVAIAMQTVHEAGVIHRDLKPTNLLLTPSGTPKITDFGLARIGAEAALSATGDVRGTYCYMSPEQVSGVRETVDHRSDIFSLGVVLYEMLALQRPFAGDTEHQIAEQIRTREPADPRSIRSQVPRDLAVIAGKALQKSPSARYSTMTEFAADLRRFLAGQPIHAKPTNAVVRAVLWAKRRPVPSIPAVALLLVIVLVTAFWSSRTAIQAAKNRELAQEDFITGMLMEHDDAESAGRPAKSISARESAISLLRRAAEMDPEMDAARLHAAVLLAELQRLDEALSVLDELRDPAQFGIVPDWIANFENKYAGYAVGPPEGWQVDEQSLPAERYYAGRSLQRGKNKAKTLRTLKPLQTDPQYAVPAMYLMGLTTSTRQARDYAEAIRWYTGASFLAPYQASIANNLASTLLAAFNSGQEVQSATYLEDALLAIERAREVNPDDTKLLRTYTAILGNQSPRDYTKLNELTLRAIRLDPENPYFRVMLGYNYFLEYQDLTEPDFELLERSESAIQDALEIDPDYALAKSLEEQLYTLMDEVLADETDE